MQPFLIQLWDLMLIQLTNWRWSWRGTMITSMIAPILSIGALSVFAQDNTDNQLGFILTGNIVLSLMFGMVGQVATHFGFLRWTGGLHYFATLPIYRIALILATLFAFMLLALPATFMTIVAGSLILQLPLKISPWVIIVIPLVAGALSGLGAIIGITGRTQESINTTATLTTFLLVFLGPVVVPPERLPQIVQVISIFSPAPYAASALRYVLLGIGDERTFFIDLLVLCGVCIALLWFANRRIDWRKVGS
jgi:ABC-2 type transport system permease protein